MIKNNDKGRIQDNFFYIANVRMPTEKAHGLQIMKMCEAFSEQGKKVTLILPRRSNLVKADPFLYYGIKKNFKIHYIPSLHILRLGSFGFFLQSFLVAIFSLLYLVGKKSILIYSRDESVLYFLSFIYKKILWEAHTPKNNFLTRRLVKKVMAVVTITYGLKDFYVSKVGFAKEKIIVQHDAVDPDQFKVSLSKEECRKKTSLPLDKKIILYAGHLYPWKGVDVLAEASKYFDEGYVVVFVGGTSYDIETFKRKHSPLNGIRVEGWKDFKMIPFYLKAADVLILPNSSKSIDKTYTSPMKLFEYMASGTPIVASRISSIEEILNDSNSVLVEPDNPKALAEGVISVLIESNKSALIAENAKNDVRNNTWDARAKSILGFI